MEKTTRTKWVSGAQLRVGDTIAVWWAPGRDTITKLEPYTGPLAHLWPDGARIATFAICQGGMTVGNGDREELVGRLA